VSSTHEDAVATAAVDPTPSAVGRPQGNFDVDANGQATYTIPIEIPPGIAGYQPHLEFVYGHRQPNGVLGVGWSLSGLSAITRTKATYAVDGFNAAVSYDSDDRYVFDGQRLINVQGEYGQPGTLYYTELQSWKYVKAGASATDGFNVTTKNGELWKYGATADSRILAAGGKDVRVWALSSTADRNGNRTDYTYTQTPLLANGTRGTAGIGAYYIDKIAYTAREGVAANRFVEFVYEQRPDVIADFTGGYPITTAYRLKRIMIRLAGDVPVRSYELGYQLSSATQLSRLETISEAGAGSVALPPTKVIWQDVNNPGFDIGVSSLLEQHLNQINLQQMDVNGDGRSDVVQLWLDQSNQINATTYLATPGPNGTTFVRASNSLLGSYPTVRQIFPADLNGDGMTDLLIAYKAGSGNLKLAVFLSNGTGFEEAAGSPFDTGDAWLDSKHLQFFPMDANGDGRTDLVEAYIRTDPNFGNLLYFRTYLSKVGDGSGQLFTRSITSPTQDPATPAKLLAFWPMDVQGDGMMDLVRIWQRGSDSAIFATAYLGVSKSLYDVSFAGRVETNLGTFALADQIALLPVDVNGDGVMDLLQAWTTPSSQGKTLHLTTFLCNAAGGFVPGPDTTFLNRTLGDFYPMAFNGRGQTALVNKWVSGDDDLMFSVFSASPSGAFREGATFKAGMNVNLAQFVPADVNGDGKADLIRVTLDPNQRPLLVPYTSSGAYPDLVSGITNALGGSVQIEYRPLSDSDVYSPSDVPAFPKGLGRRYPNPLTPTQFPVQAVLGQATYVVSGYTQTSDPQLNRFAYQNTYSMSYAAARLDLLGRGWEGFGSVSKLSLANGSITTHNYNQDFPYTGTLASTRLEADGTHATDPRVASDQTGVLVSLGSNTYNAYTRATGATGLHPAVVEVLMMTSRLERYDYGADNFDYALGQKFDYDGYGNQTTNIQLGYVDQNGTPLNPAEIVYRYNLYQNQILDQGWVLGLLQYAKVTSNAVNTNIQQFLPGDYHLEQHTYTPVTYNEQSFAQWDDAHNEFLVVSYEYDIFGNRTAETHPGNRTTRWLFDPDYNTFQMRMTTPQNAQGQSLTTEYGYDPRYGAVVARRNPDSQIVIMALDGLGRTVLRQGPIPDSPGAVGDPNQLTQLVTGAADLRQSFLSAEVVTLETTAYLNDGAKGLYSEVRSLQKFPVDSTRDFTWQQKYVDGLARERETYNQSGQSAGNVLVLKDYNAEGRVTLESPPFFSTTAVVSAAPYSITSTYDVLGRELTHTVPAGPEGNESSLTTWVYGKGGKVTRTQGAGSNSPYVQIFENHYFDGKQQTRKIVVPADGNATTIFEFDPIARMTKATDPATAANPQGVSNTITFDSLDRRRTFDNPDQNTTQDPNIKAMTYECDPITGLLQQETDAAGQVTRFEYDKLDRTLTKSLGDGTVIRYTYDDPTCNGQGRLTQVKVEAPDHSVQSQYDYCYDKYGNSSQVTVTIAGESFITSSVYDPQQRLVSQTMPDLSVMTREYAFGKVITEALDGARADYPLENYNPSGKAGKLTYGTGAGPAASIATEYTFNPVGQVYREVLTAGAGKVLDLAYAYDSLNQLLNITDNTGLGSNRSQAFTYLNKRLKTAVVPGFDDASYEYDASGNLTTKEGVTYSYQAHFATKGMANNEEVFSATPDACGRTKTRSAGGQDLIFEYDGLGCLQRVKTTSGNMLREMISDYQGLRLRQVNADGSQVTYVSPAYQVMRSADGKTSIIKNLLDDRGAAATITTGATSNILYCRRDHKGSTTDTFDITGTLVTSVSYSGYGVPRVLSGADGIAVRYEQRPWDDLLELYYFGARYYDPVTGRFLTPDSQIGGSSLLQADVLNRFAFELNNPVNNVDLTGHGIRDVLIGIGIGLVLIAIGAAIILTGGAAAPLGAIAAGALLGAGLNAGIYSLTHRNQDAATFYKGFAVDVAVGAVIGAATAGISFGIGNVATSLSTRAVAAWSLEGAAGRAATFAIRAAVYIPVGAALGSGGDVANQYAMNMIDRGIGGQDVSTTRSLETVAITGAAFGVFAGFGQAASESALISRIARRGYYERNEEWLNAMFSGESEAVRQPLLRAIEENRVRIVVLETVKSRAILFGVSEASTVADAIVEGFGY
jgi:RHS repeat-associated core domain